MSYVLLGLLYMKLAAASFSSTSNSIFDNLTSPDVKAIRERLEEERAHTLLLQNDVEVLMEKVARLERDTGNRVQTQSQQNGKFSLCLYCIFTELLYSVDAVT